MMNTFLYFFFLGVLLTLAPPCENMSISSTMTTLKVPIEVDEQKTEPSTTPTEKGRETTIDDKQVSLEVKHDIQDGQSQEGDVEHVVKENDVTTSVPVDKSVENDIQPGISENITLSQKESEVADEKQNKSTTPEEVKIPEEEQSTTEVKIPEEEQSTTEVKIPEEEQITTEVKIPEEEQDTTSGVQPEEEKNVSTG
ncbi:110 kDa antigen-like [Limulus polyphemus]|uniref:110 kDa antigen-like n=1 Tax=Limulus polyphemus TaxID=6850 RepID=A0ABM1B1U1_LIMPO|nr:110 kDa antigen-like [Limulus polyphemus]